MVRSSLILIIGLTLVGFILFKGVASLLCETQQQNSVANVISNVVSNVAPDPTKAPAKPDPLSWDPFIHRMINLFSKACPK